VPHPSSSSSTSRNEVKSYLREEKPGKYFEKSQLASLIKSSQLSELMGMYCKIVAKDLEREGRGLIENAIDRDLILQVVFQVADTLLQLYKKQS